MNTPIAPERVSGTVLTVTSFLRLVEELLREPTERAAYLADPAGYLPARGFEDFDTADVELSMQLTADAFPPALAARLDPSEGLDSVISVDIDEVPGLWTDRDEAPTFDEMADADDPFLDDAPDTVDTVDTEDTADITEASDTTAADDSAITSDSVDQAFDGSEQLPQPSASDTFEVDDTSDGLTSPPEFDLDAGFPDDFADSVDAVDPVDAELAEPGGLDIDDVPFD